jgi:hypothetical protein
MKIGRIQVSRCREFGVATKCLVMVGDAYANDATGYE